VNRPQATIPESHDHLPLRVRLQLVFRLRLMLNQLSDLNRKPNGCASLLAPRPRRLGIIDQRGELAATQPTASELV
jgi:hypothetical protein